jgi:phage-related protein
MKPVIFAGRSLTYLKRFPINAKREAGFQLDKLQHGDEPTDWKPFKTVGSNVREVRITDSPGVYRVIYVAKFSDAVYVLHAFQKKTQKTAKLDIEAAKAAYKLVLEDHNE